MADFPTPDQIGTGAVWFESKAGITATILAVVAIALAVAYVWERMSCRREINNLNDAWVKACKDMAEAWAKRIDQMRSDTKEAFEQNAKLAEKIVEAMHSLKIEIARMSGRRDRD